MKLLALVGLACAVVAISTETETLPNSLELLQETEGNTIGCKFWRVRSITDTPGEWWQVSEIEFYASADGSGEKVAPTKAMASTFKGDINTSENKAEAAIDGSADTFWSTSDKYKFEWIGVEFDAPQEIASIKMQLTELNMGPAMVIVEKSLDGEWWSRSTEVADMKEWGDKMETYPLITMNHVPTSIFAFRSQDNPRFCVGVRPTPHPTDEKADPFPLAEDAVLEVQICNDNTNTQYFALDEMPRPMLKNAADQSFVLHINGTTAAGTTLGVKQCRDGCPDGFDDDVWAYGGEAAGGVAFNKNAPNLVLYPKGGVLEEGTEVTLEACGADGETAATAACADKPLARWELLPMFILEDGKQTVACAPYSHDNVEPAPADNRAAAQELCAKDTACTAYNWVDANAEGAIKDKSYSCTAMHEVHSGVQGWELGIRGGSLVPFVELKEAATTRKWTMYSDL